MFSQLCSIKMEIFRLIGTNTAGVVIKAMSTYGVVRVFVPTILPVLNLSNLRCRSQTNGFVRSVLI